MNVQLLLKTETNIQNMGRQYIKDSILKCCTNIPREERNAKYATEYCRSFKLHMLMNHAGDMMC